MYNLLKSTQNIVKQLKDTHYNRRRVARSNLAGTLFFEGIKCATMEKYSKNISIGSGGVRTHASEETGA